MTSNKKICKVKDCNNKHYAKGYCAKHYYQMKKYGQLTPERELQTGNNICKVEGCNNEYYAKGYCRRHYDQIRWHGQIVANKLPNNKKTKEKSKCKAEYCDRDSFAKGYCHKHYQQFLKHGRLTPEIERELQPQRYCKVPGCSRKHHGLGYCNKHYQYFRSKYKHYTADKKNRKLIKEVQSLANKLGRTPKKREFKESPSACWRFGTWNNFLIAAGLIPLKESNLTIEDYENIIHDFIKKHGRVPTQKDFYDDIYLPDPTAIERKFKKTWNEILLYLGYKPNVRMNDFTNMTDEELLSIVKSELERIGSTKIVDYRESRTDNSPSEKYLTDRLNMTWNDILKLLELETNVERRSKKEWLQLLKDAANDLGKTPSINDLLKYGLNESTYKLNFGSYNNAVRKAGLEPNIELTEVTHTDKELFDMYVNLCKKLGRVAVSKDMDKHLPYNSDVFAIRFGGLNNLREMAGYESHFTRRKYTEKEVKKQLLSTYDKYKRRLTNSELNQLSKENEDFPSISTICRYFKTTKMSEVWEQIEKGL